MREWALRKPHGNLKGWVVRIGDYLICRPMGWSSLWRIDHPFWDWSSLSGSVIFFGIDHPFRGSAILFRIDHPFWGPVIPFGIDHSFRGSVIPFGVGHLFWAPPYWSVKNYPHQYDDSDWVGGLLIGLWWWVADQFAILGCWILFYFFIFLFFMGFPHSGQSMGLAVGIWQW